VAAAAAAADAAAGADGTCTAAGEDPGADAGASAGAEAGAGAGALTVRGAPRKSLAETSSSSSAAGVSALTRLRAVEEELTPLLAAVTSLSHWARATGPTDADLTLVSGGLTSGPSDATSELADIALAADGLAQALILWRSLPDLALAVRVHLAAAEAARCFYAPPPPHQPSTPTNAPPPASSSTVILLSPDAVAAALDRAAAALRAARAATASVHAAAAGALASSPFAPALASPHTAAAAAAAAAAAGPAATPSTATAATSANGFEQQQQQQCGYCCCRSRRGGRNLLTVASPDDHPPGRRRRSIRARHGPRRRCSGCSRARASPPALCYPQQQQWRRAARQQWRGFWAFLYVHDGRRWHVPWDTRIGRRCRGRRRTWFCGGGGCGAGVLLRRPHGLADSFCP